MLLLRLIEWIYARRLVVLAIGLAAEVAALLLIGTDDAVRGVRGVGGETAVILAIIGAVFGGPAVGAAMAIVGWAVFFPLVAVQRDRAIAERQRAAAHALRTPIATIHGLVRVLSSRDRHDDVDRRIVASIEDETGRLLRSEVFEPPST